MGNPHAGFDEAGAWKRALSTAAAFDPTCAGGAGAGIPTATIYTAAIHSLSGIINKM